MSADDSALYTGVDNPAEDAGIFGNESLDDATKEQIQEQERKIRELTPQLEGILEMIDAEIKSIMSIDGYLDATKFKEKDIRAELRATALYKQYLEGLKTKFTLQLNEASNK